MKLVINGAPKEVAATTLAAVLAELDFTGSRMATAVNGTFVPRPARENFALNEGDRIEIVTPRQGG